MPARLRTLLALALLAALAAAAPAPAQESEVTRVSPGVSLQRLVEAGPQVFHILRVAPGVPGLSVAPALTGGSPLTRGLLSAAVRDRAPAGVVAGINGDFFSLSEGYPSGLLLLGGSIVNEPEPSRSALLLPPAAPILAARLALVGRFQAIDPAGLVTFPVRTFGGVNRPAERGSETLLYTPAVGPATPRPRSNSRYEAVIALDGGVPLVNAPLVGTVVAAGPGGETPIGPGQVVISAVGAAAPGVAAGLVPGRRVNLEISLVGLPPGTLDGIGGGPLLVQSGIPIADAGEGFSAGQTDSRTTRSAVGQTADGTLLLVTSEGPAQGSRGFTVAEQAEMMARFGAVTAIALDAGGSAQLAVDGRLAVPTASERAITTALFVSYRGTRLLPLDRERLSPNGDGVDETALTAVRSPLPGVLTVTVTRRRGEPVPLARERYEGGDRVVSIDPPAIGRSGLLDGPYTLTARLVPDDGTAPTEESRPLIIDSTLAALRLRPARLPAVRRRPRQELQVRFRLTRPARVTVRVESTGGRVLRTLRAGRGMRRGEQVVRWDRTLRRKPAVGTHVISVEAHTFLGRTSLRRSVTLAAPPRPRGRD